METQVNMFASCIKADRLLQCEVATCPFLSSFHRFSQGLAALYGTHGGYVRFGSNVICVMTESGEGQDVKADTIFL